MAPNDDTEQVTCLHCGKIITVVLDYHGDEPDTGIRAGWFGGIAIEDTACFEHLTFDQRDAVLDAAIAQHGSEPPDDGADMARITAEE